MLPVAAGAVVSAILIFSVGAWSMTLYVLEEIAEFNDVCTSLLLFAGLDVVGGIYAALRV